MKRLIVLAASIAVMLALCCPASAVSWSSFVKINAPTGVSVLPSVASGGVLDYTVELATNAWLTFSGSAPDGYDTTSRYGIAWIQGFYLQSKDETATFTATNGFNPGWTWDTDPVGAESFSVAGWNATGGSKGLKPGKTHTFKFADLSNSGEFDFYGFQVGLDVSPDRDSGITAADRHNNIFFVKDPPPPSPPLVPEPISLALAGLGFTVVGLRRRFAR